MSFSISESPIDADALKRRLEAPSRGACAIFEGWVRDHNEGKAALRLEYSAYEALAKNEGQRILQEALSRFDIEAACCVHRIGSLEIGDLAVWVGVSSGHRDAAFDSCRYVIDEIKQRVPIWKKEHYADGSPSEWVNASRTPKA